MWGVWRFWDDEVFYGTKNDIETISVDDDELSNEAIIELSLLFQWSIPYEV